MSDQATNGLLAVGLGVVVALVLLIPTAAWQYRLDGRLGRRDVGLLVSAAVYGVALWTYTLLPFPADGSLLCQSFRLDPMTSLRGVGRSGFFAYTPLAPGTHVFTTKPDFVERHTHHLPLWRDPVLLQLLLNVALFLPLGYFVRAIARPRRGVLVTVALGLGISLLIETTQLTGDWHLFDCAYRTFDVDDLATNTLGALLGALLAAVLVRRRHPAPVPLPATVTVGRRLVGLVCDGVFLVLAAAVTAGAHRFAVDRLPLGDGGYPSAAPVGLLVGVPFALEALAVLTRGRSVGELAISVRTVAPADASPVRLVAARLVKLLTGVAPLPLLALVGDAIGGPVGVLVSLTGAGACVVVAVVAAVRTRGHRGLANVLAGLDVEIAADEQFDSDHDGRPGVAGADGSNTT